MRTYVIREGSKYLLEQIYPNKRNVTSAVADRDISFDESELVEVDTWMRTLIFAVGNRKYHANRDNVSVLD
jgi:hypothetical protein